MVNRKIWVVPTMRGVIVPDPNSCSGCGGCELVCSLFHEGECNPTLARIHVFREVFTGENTPEVCKQCLCPECLSACPVEAIKIDAKTGARVIVEEYCTGCEKCMAACLFNEKKTILRFNPEKNVAIKCDLCSGEPQCIKVCPHGALKHVKIGEA